MGLRPHTRLAASSVYSRDAELQSVRERAAPCTGIFEVAIATFGEVLGMISRCERKGMLVGSAVVGTASTLHRAVPTSTSTTICRSGSIGRRRRPSVFEVYVRCGARGRRRAWDLEAGPTGWWTRRIGAPRSPDHPPRFAAGSVSAASLGAVSTSCA